MYHLKDFVFFSHHVQSTERNVASLDSTSPSGLATETKQNYLQWAPAKTPLFPPAVKSCSGGKTLPMLYRHRQSLAQSGSRGDLPWLRLRGVAEVAALAGGHWERWELRSGQSPQAPLAPRL